MICAILSIFPDSREWCRKNLSRYFEVFVDATLEQVIARDVKGIYSRFKKGEVKDVAGLDLEFPIPQNPDLWIKNNASLADFLENSKIIADLFDQ